MENKTNGIWMKLLAIQKAFTSFAISEESEKTDNRTGKSAYRYTPGWKITEEIRKHMDKAGLLLLPSFNLNEATTVEYPVYKMVGGTPMSFTKKEIHVVLTAEYTWLDAATGETAGPFRIVASGANGTDKSTASALALAERYFLLKFFHISTRDLDEEPDAHDADTVPGIPKNQQFPANPADACMASPFGAAPAAGFPAQGGAPRQPYQGGFQGGFQGAYQGPGPQPIAPQGLVTIYPQAPDYGRGAPRQNGGVPFNDGHPAIRQAAARLSNYDKATDTFRTELNQVLGNLASVGINCTDPTFIQNLTEAAQAMREGRQPNYV